MHGPMRDDNGPVKIWNLLALVSSDNKVFDKTELIGL